MPEILLGLGGGVSPTSFDQMGAGHSGVAVRLHTAAAQCRIPVNDLVPWCRKPLRHLEAQQSVIVRRVQSQL